AGTRTITAILIADPSVTLSTTVRVVPAAAASLQMTPSALRVDEGASVTLDLTLEDGFGNALPTDQVIITSDHASDVIRGTTVTFPTASTHVLTATFGTLTSTVAITVVPASAPSSGSEPSAGSGASSGTGFAGGSAAASRLSTTGFDAGPLVAIALV